MLLQLLHGASENPPLSTTGTNYPPFSKKNENDAGSCYATAAYYPPIATTEAYFAQNGEIIV